MQAEPICPKCAGVKCARIKRRGFWQVMVLARLGRFPWECGDCRNVFIAKARGKRRPHRTRPKSESQSTQIRSASR